ncbi:glycosyltransferase [Enterococcus faecium]|uniref:glycosyltransferase n=1 Tax=Enterococcus faecium TaxID=1352 RepID=UPI0023B30B2E|nr:hypothetical protein [Enterococcus faecium]
MDTELARSMVTVDKELVSTITPDEYKLGVRVIAGYELEDGEGIPELVQSGENGHLVDIGDTQAMSETLSILLRNEEQRTKISQHARETIEESYVLKSYIICWNKLYKNQLD